MISKNEVFVCFRAVEVRHSVIVLFREYWPGLDGEEIKINEKSEETSK